MAVCIAIESAPTAQTAEANCRALEDGCILVVADAPLTLSAAMRAELLACPPPDAAHKNISYDRGAGRLTGLAGAADPALLRQALSTYGEQIAAWLTPLLSPYAKRWRMDATSFRPREEAGRSLPWRARNDLLHIDAFPARPTNGARILRVFTNLHPGQPRRWVTTEPFEELARRLGGRAPRPDSPIGSLRRWLAPRAPVALAPLLRRSPYDALMQRMHDRMKADPTLQATLAKATHDFPPGATWVAFTDAVAHAVTSGRSALEQTFFVPCDAMLEPEKSPLRVLERLHGVRLSDEAR